MIKFHFSVYWIDRAQKNYFLKKPLDPRKRNVNIDSTSTKVYFLCEINIYSKV